MEKKEEEAKKRIIKKEDESVYRISPSSIVNSEAYILIYKLRE